MTETKGNENIVAAIAYLGLWGSAITVLIVALLVEKKSKFVIFHALQSIIFFVALTVLFIVVGRLPIIGWILTPFILIGGFIFWLILMWKAFQGETYKMPYVGDLAEKQLAKMG